MSRVYMIVVLILLPFLGSAQSEGTIIREYISRAAWEEKTVGKEYDFEVKKEEVEEEYDPADFGPFFRFFLQLAPLLKGALIVLFIGLLAFLLIKMIPVYQENKEQKVIDYEVEITDAEQLTHQLQLHKLEYSLQQFLGTMAYRSAIRTYYLMVVKLLEENGHITWRKEKTNMDYIRELEGTALMEVFKTLTKAYENAWFGFILPTEEEFTVLSTSFDNFLQEIKNQSSTPKSLSRG
ncbi:DUF4129 domain-containing protein [Algivirga pacifica]|uniref:Protein-glutamine gamma-glutamyltransferase-like C-terminal domain-containing protein n=1 Tax=Algivirga pacifica TaxID=1162670 RepID=A0ABP9DDQ6_9BACT